MKQSKTRFFSLLCATFYLGCAIAADAVPPLYEGQSLDVKKGKAVYATHCASCHETGKDKAPRLAKRKAWSKASLESFSTMLDHAKHGFLMMPAEGGQPTLSDADLANAVYYISNRLSRR